MFWPAGEEPCSDYDESSGDEYLDVAMNGLEELPKDEVVSDSLRGSRAWGCMHGTWVRVLREGMAQLQLTWVVQSISKGLSIYVCTTVCRGVCMYMYVLG